MSDAPKTSLVLGVHVVRVEAALQGLSVGILTGLAIFVATNWLVLKGGTVVGPHLALLAQFLVGYDVTFMGSLVGFAWGFVYGFLAAYGVGRLYNRIVAVRAHRE